MLFRSAERSTRSTLDLDIVRLEKEEDRLERFARYFSDVLRFSLALDLFCALARSERTFSVISANARAALRWRSTLSE